MSKNKNFELQLVVIGILITAYWQLLPGILNPIRIAGYDFKLSLLYQGFIISGMLWFVTLLIGTFSLAFKQKKIKIVFSALFKISNIITLWIILTILFIYAIFIISSIL